MARETEIIHIKGKGKDHSLQDAKGTSKRYPCFSLRNVRLCQRTSTPSALHISLSKALGSIAQPTPVLTRQRSYRTHKMIAHL